MSLAAYAELLARVEETRQAVRSRREVSRRARRVLDEAEKLEQRFSAQGLAYENEPRSRARQAFAAGDYDEAARLATAATEFFAGALAQYEQLTAERENLARLRERAEAQKLVVETEILAEIDEALRNCDFAAAKELMGQAHAAFAAAMDEFSQAETFVQQLRERIASSRGAILVETFEGQAARAQASLAARDCETALATAREGIEELGRALAQWLPEPAVALPEVFVAGEWNKVSLRVTNEGRAHAGDVSVTFEGLKQQGEFTLAQLGAGEAAELEGALYPDAPGSVKVVTRVTGHRAHDEKEFEATREQWIEVARPGAVAAEPSRVRAAAPAVVALHRERVPAWHPPATLSGDEQTLVEFFTRRRDCYRAWPENQTQLDYLHNNQERFAVSSYFEVPTDSGTVLHEWGLPENLRGNVHLDEVRASHLEQIIASSPDSNFVILGEPGVGKTVLLYELFDALLMEGGPVGLITTAAVGDTHARLGLRLFYDDIPENPELLEALLARETTGVILTAREADWQKLPERFQRLYKRLTVPLFSDAEMVPLCHRMLGFSAIRYDQRAVERLVSYARGSPIYVWSLIREMLFSGNRLLTRAYLGDNAQKGMENYVAMILQRLLKEGAAFRPGGVHALACLVFLADYMQDRRCHELLFRSFADEVEAAVEQTFGDRQNTLTFNHAVAYLSGEGSLIRFPHDTWADVLAGAGSMNPFRAEIQALKLKIADDRYEAFKQQAVEAAWDVMLRRYRRNSVREKESFLGLANVLTDNFRLRELEALGVDVEMVREVASLDSDLPLAARILSRLQAARPTRVTRIINIQDSIISRSTLNLGEGETRIEDSLVHRVDGDSG